MHVVIVDDEHLVLKDIERVVRGALPECALFCFDAPSGAIAHAEANRTDIAFVDIEMGGMNGLELARRLKEINGQTNIIFVTGYSEYAIDSYSIPASGYIMKPASVHAIVHALDHLRNPVVKTDKRLRVQCFGNFDVFAGAVPLHFPRRKAKELFAYLIHKRGASCTIRELIAILFEDKEENNSLRRQVQTYISTMTKTLKDADAKDVIIKKFNSLAVDTTKVDCDYYRFLQWDIDAVNRYSGEYMSNYSWAEFMAGHLDRTFSLKRMEAFAQNVKLISE